jgi:hypothetical protein
MISCTWLVASIVNNYLDSSPLQQFYNHNNTVAFECCGTSHPFSLIHWDTSQPIHNSTSNFPHPIPLSLPTSSTTVHADDISIDDASNYLNPFISSHMAEISTNVSLSTLHYSIPCMVAKVIPNIEIKTQPHPVYSNHHLVPLHPLSMINQK